MTTETFPSPNRSHRRADAGVHAVGLCLIVTAGSILVINAMQVLSAVLICSVVVYVLCALASILASIAYHFSAWHDKRPLFRRIDHAAIYLSISGTFTPIFVLAGTTWTWSLLVFCWGLTALAVWNKITSATVKSKWSTASYLGLGAIGLCAMPDLTGTPVATVWCIAAGAASYVFGIVFYARRTMPYRFAIWHTWVNIGGICMFAGIWVALF